MNLVQGFVTGTWRFMWLSAKKQRSKLERYGKYATQVAWETIIELQYKQKRIS